MNQPPPIPPQLPTANPQLSEKKARTWPVFTMLFLFYPVGVALLWFSKAFTPKAKKVWSLVWLPWFLFVLAQPGGKKADSQAAPKANTVSTSESEDSKAPPASYDAHPLEVELTASAQSRGQAIVIEGKTNLPDGTKIRLEARNILCQFSANAIVHGGKFTSPPLPDKGGIQPGLYSMYAFSEAEPGQPQSVRRRIGKHGVNLTGNLAETKEGFGDPWKRARLYWTVEIGDKEKGMEALLAARSNLAQKVEKALVSAQSLHDRMKGILTEISTMSGDDFQRERARLMGDARRLRDEAGEWNDRFGGWDAKEPLNKVDGHLVHGADWESSNLGVLLTQSAMTVFGAFRSNGSFELKDRDGITLQNDSRERESLLAKSRQALADFMDTEKMVARMTGTDTPAQAKEKQERDAKRKEKWAKWEERRKQNPAPRPDATAKPYRVIDTELGQSLTTVWIYSDTASCWEEFALTVKQAAEDTFRANPSHPRVAASLMRTPSKDGGTIALQANAFFDSQATDASRWQIQAKRLVPNPKEQQIVKAWVEGWQSGLRRTEDLQKAASEKLGITAEDVDFPLEELEAYPVK